MILFFIFCLAEVALLNIASIQFQPYLSLFLSFYVLQMMFIPNFFFYFGTVNSNSDASIASLLPKSSIPTAE